MRAPAVVFGPDFLNRLVNHFLQFGWSNVSKGSASITHSLLKNAPSHSLLDELRQITFLHSLGTEKRTQRMICFFGPGNGQSSVFVLEFGTFSHISIYPTVSLYDYGLGKKNAGGLSQSSEDLSPVHPAHFFEASRVHLSSVD